MRNAKSGGGNPLQQSLMLPVKCLRLFRGQRRSNPPAGTDAAAPGNASKGQFNFEFVVGPQTEPVPRPGRMEFRVFAPARSAGLRIVLGDQFVGLSCDAESQCNGFVPAICE